MADLPEEFPCTVTNWEYIYGLCHDVADQVRASDYEPEVLVALARGGWFAGRCLCDFLGLDDLTSLKMEHYVGTAERTGEPVVRYPMPEGSVDGKDVLIVDDIADTGGSIRLAHEYVTDREPATVRTSTLQVLGTSSFEPDFVGERIDEWAWIVYPWNFIEDMADLLTGVMEKAEGDRFSEADLRGLLDEYHDVGRMELEIAQPNRFGEVLSEMERRGLVTTESGVGWRLGPEA